MDNIKPASFSKDQKSLSKTVKKEKKPVRIKKLIKGSGKKGRIIITVCARCKRVSDNKGKWFTIDLYKLRYSGLLISHGLCSTCCDTLYGKEEWYRKVKNKIS